MQRPAAFLGLILLATAAGAEEPGGGPLEGTKQELKALQADQTAAKNGVATGKLSEGLPQFQSPVPGAAAPEFLNPEKLRREMKRKNADQKNWLLDGVGRLEKEGRAAKAQGKPSSRHSSEAEEEPLSTDRSDPDYLLKLYREQNRGRATQRGPGELRDTAQRSDPMAPFLQDWLSESPVRGKFFDAFVKKQDTGDAPGSAADSVSGLGPGRPGYSGEHSGSERVVAGAGPTTNPYLQVQEMPAPQDRSSLNQGPGPAASSVPPAAFAPVVPVALGPNPAVRPEEKTPSLLAPSDNQKYFPQQKKF